MALVLANRVQETGTANTTVSFTLAGPVQGFQSFSAVGDGNTTYYSATDGSGNWEVGLGTYSTTGPTLTRTTVYASSNAGNAVTFSGAVNVFVTYPSGRSVNLNETGNVSALGTVSSGTWQGSTVDVAYGGTGVTSSSGANSVMIRDANQNVAVNRLNQSNTDTTAAGGTTALTAASSYSQTLTGTGNQSYTMPDATTLTTGVAFVFNNNATGTLTLKDYAGATIGTITTGGACELVLLANGTVGGTWDVHGFLPESVTWGTNALNLGSTVISNGTWNGGTITPAYGGTGLTSFTTNGAVYATGTTTLTSGTLPVISGGTGTISVPTNGQLLIGNGSTYTAASLGAGTGISTTTGAGTLTINNTGVTSLAGTSPVTASASTGSVTMSLASGYGDTQNPYASKTANFFLAAPNGSAGAPTFRAIVAADIPTLNQNTTGSAGSVANAVTFNNGGAGDASGTTFNGSAARTISYNTVGAPSTTGTNATGTWAINISGNAATATSATDSTKLPLSGGTMTGTISFNTAFNVQMWRHGSNGPGVRSDGTYLVLARGSGGGGDQQFYIDGFSNILKDGNIVLHAGNYNSYAPTLTGTGASGTWGISISGNAATATTASNASLLNSISAVNLYNNMGDTHSTRTSFDATTPSYGFGYRYVQGSTNGPGTGGTQYYSWYIGLGSDYPATGAGSYGAMFAIDRNVTTPYLSVRYNESNSFSAWRKVAAGYADSAGSAGSVAWGNVTSKPSNIMYYQSFTLDANTMDSNATGFTYSVNAPYTGPIVRFSTGGSYDLWLNSPYSSGGYGLAFRTRNGDTATLNNWQYPAVYGINANGGGALYATIYYDQNDTGYYVDPASTSNLNVVNLLNGKWYPVNNASGNSAEIYVRPDNNNTYVWRHIYGGTGTGYGTGAGGYGIYCQHLGGDYSLILSSSGFVTAPYSLRAPIFYDSNNTAYYVDPNGVTNLGGVNDRPLRVLKTSGVNSTAAVFENQYGDNSWGIVSEFRIGAGSGTDSPSILFSQGYNSNTWSIGFGYNDTDYFRIRHDHGWRNSGWGTTDWYCDRSGNTWSVGSSRAPIFYDSDDTGYYVNPNGTSNLYGPINLLNSNVARRINVPIDSRGVWDGSLNGYLLLAKAYVGGIQVNSEVTGRFFLSRGSTGEGRRTETIEVFSKSAYNSESFLVNWPGGREFTAGTLHKVTYAGTVYHAIRLGQFGGGPYQGFTFDGWTTNAGLIVVYDSEVSGVTSYGASGYYVDLSGSFFGLTDVRSPIFYDSNDTGYYLDPNSTSNSALRIRGGTLHGPNPTWGAYLYVGTDGGYIGSTSTVAVTNGNLHLDAQSGYSLYLAWYNTSNIMVGGGIQATIYYDRDNTGYYCDPASTSQLNSLTVGGTLNCTNGGGYSAFMYGNGNTGSVSGIGMNVYSTGGNGAVMAFHRGGYYAVNMGLDSDNVFRIGGWSASANRLQLDMSGNLTLAGNVAASSDERLKTNWRDLPANFVEQLAKVKTGVYDRVDEEGLTQVGVSAQSLLPVLPDAVVHNADGMLGVAYGNAALVAAVKLAEKVLLLEQRIKQLEGST